MSSRLPGLVRWSARMFGDDIASRVFSPLLADWQHDIRGGPSGLARHATHARWLVAFTRTALAVGARELVHWRVPREEARPVLRTAALFALGGVGLACTLGGILLLAYRGRLGGPSSTVILLVNLASIIGPLAIGPAAVQLARAHSDADARRWMLGALALSLACAQLLILGWGLPALSDLAWGERVCTIGAFRTAPSIPLHHFLRPRPPGATGVWWSVSLLEVARRLAWVALPLAISAFAWRLGSQRSRRHVAWLATAWAVPAVLMLMPSLVAFYLPLGGEYSIAITLVRYLPIASLLALAWWLGPAPRETAESTAIQSTEAR